MASKAVILVLGIVILGASLQEIDAAAPAQPTNRMIEPKVMAKKCFVYSWMKACNCTIQIDAKLSMANMSKMIGPFKITKPFTKGDKQGVCFHNKGVDAMCCDDILNGTKAAAQTVDFGDYVYIAFNLTRTNAKNESTTSVDAKRMVPWKMACMNNPCMYGTCAADGKSYKCTCESGITGTNCTDLTGWKKYMGKCLRNGKVVKTVDQSLSKCAETCKSMNSKKSHGCKAIQYKKKQCQLFAVSMKFDKKKHIDCSNSTLFELEKLPDLTGYADSLTSSFVNVLCLAFFALILM